MSDQIRAVVFVVIALVILFAWGHFYKPPAAPQPQPAQTAVQETTPQAPGNTSASAGTTMRQTNTVAAASATRIQAGKKNQSSWRVRSIWWNFRIAVAWCEVGS
jgi:hypothetical protein